MNSMIPFIVALVGAAIALISWFGFHQNWSGVIIGAVIAFIGILFRGSGGRKGG
jgi:hypothetical protein